MQTITTYRIFQSDLLNFIPRETYKRLTEAFGDSALYTREPVQDTTPYGDIHDPHYFEKRNRRPAHFRLFRLNVPAQLMIEGSPDPIEYYPEKHFIMTDSTGKVALYTADQIPEIFHPKYPLRFEDIPSFSLDTLVNHSDSSRWNDAKPCEPT